MLVPLAKQLKFGVVQRVDTSGGRDASFAMLSENSFVLPRFSRSRKADEHIHRNSFGILDVYRFGTSTSASTKPICVASFALPPVIGEDAEVSVRIRCARTTVTSTSRNYSDTVPKVFEVAQSNRLLYLDMISVAEATGYTSEAICVPSSLFLSILPAPQQRDIHHSSPVIVPWADWAERALRVDKNALELSGDHFMYGQRMAGFKGEARFNWSKHIFVFDFDQSRLKSRGMLDVPAAGIVRNLDGGVITSDNQNQPEGCTPLGGDARVVRRYTELVIPLKERVDSSDKVIIDDERGKSIYPIGDSLMSYDLLQWACDT